MGEVPTAIEHDVHGDAVAVATMGVGTARMPRTGHKPESAAPQFRADAKLEVRVGHTWESEYHHGSFTCGHMSSYQREVLLCPSSSLRQVNSYFLKVHDRVFYE